MKALRTLTVLGTLAATSGVQAASFGDISIYMDWSTLSITGASMTLTTFTDPQTGEVFSSDAYGWVENQYGWLSSQSALDGDSAIASYTDATFTMAGGYDATDGTFGVADASGGSVSVSNNSSGEQAGYAGGWNGFFYQATSTGQVTISVDYQLAANISTTTLIDDYSSVGYELFMDAVDADLWSSSYAAAIDSGSSPDEAELAAEAAATLDEYFFNNWNLLACTTGPCSDSLSTSGTVSVSFDAVSGTTYAFGADAVAGVYTESVSAVPVPAAAWLFGSGLIGLVGIARRKNS